MTEDFIVKAEVALLMVLVGGALAWARWSLHKRFASQEEFKLEINQLEDKVEEIQHRQELIKKDLEHLPDPKEFASIKTDIGVLRSETRGISRDLKASRGQLESLNAFLRESK